LQKFSEPFSYEVLPRRNFPKHFPSRICLAEIFKSIFLRGFALQKFSEAFFLEDLPCRKFY
jgi:hypothetical protein